MKKEDIAKLTFNNGYNCAQSVLTPFAIQMGIDVSSIMKLASGFGAGMGRLQETCGAVTGAYMVLGLKYGNRIPDDNSNEKIVGLIQEFTKRFRDEHKVASCRELLNCNLKTPEGQQYFTDNDLYKNVCSKCVNTAVTILEELGD